MTMKLDNRHQCDIYKSFELYDDNYHKLMTLLPFMHYLKEGICVKIEGIKSLRMMIMQRTPYTTTVNMMLYLEVENRWVTDPALKICIYHDVCVAEVLAYQDYKQFMPIYPYPNPHMLNRFEKRRVNEFLGDCLEYSLAHLRQQLKETALSES